MNNNSIVRKGDVIDLPEYGLVRFDGFDYYNGEKTAKLYSSEFRDFYYPFPDDVEKHGFQLFDG